MVSAQAVFNIAVTVAVVFLVIGTILIHGALASQVKENARLEHEHSAEIQQLQADQKALQELCVRDALPCVLLVTPDQTHKATPQGARPLATPTPTPTAKPTSQPSILPSASPTCLLGVVCP